MAIFDFLKKRKEIRPEEPWAIGERYEGDKPVLYRVRQAVPDGIFIKDYPYLLSILWEYEIDSNRSGMPSDEQNNQHVAFDDALDQIDNKGTGTLMVAVTGNGRKEWIWYVNDPDVWLSGLQECLQGHPVYPLDIQKSDAAGWETWKAIRDGMK